MGNEPADYWGDEIDKYHEEVISQYLDDFGDDFASQYYEDHVKEFTWDRLRSYFLQHPDVIVPAVNYLTEARALLSVSPRAALVFASGAGRTSASAKRSGCQKRNRRQSQEFLLRGSGGVGDG